MNDKTYKKLTIKEKKIVDDIEKKTSKRKHKKTYTTKFILEHIMCTSFFKGWGFDTKEDAEDLMDSIVEVASKMGALKKDINTYRKDITKMYIEAWFEDG